MWNATEYEVAVAEAVESALKLKSTDDPLGSVEWMRLFTKFEALGRLP